jgi:hypothetical protein
MADCCRDLLSQGLDLCVRARKLDAMNRRTVQIAACIDPIAWQESGRFDTFVERHNIENPAQEIATRSGTPALWVQDQYERDLHEWESRARKHLMQGCQP